MLKKQPSSSVNNSYYKKHSTTAYTCSTLVDACRAIATKVRFLSFNLFSAGAVLHTKKLVLVKIPFSRFLKLEVPQFVNEVIGIVEKHDPKALMIDGIFNNLVAEKFQIRAA